MLATHFKTGTWWKLTYEDRTTKLMVVDKADSFNGRILTLVVNPFSDAHRSNGEVIKEAAAESVEYDQDN